MAKQHMRKWLGALLIALLLQPVIPMQSEAAQRPKAEDISSGYLVIGTYLVHRNALNTKNLNAAKATMSESEQGVYYKSELADGKWFNIESAIDIQAIISGGTDAKEATEDDINDLKLILQITAQGDVIPFLTPAEIQDKIDALKEERKEKGDDYSSAVKKKNQGEQTRLTRETADLDGQIAFLEALKNAGDSLSKQQATELMEKMNAPLDPNTVTTKIKDAMSKVQEDLKEQQATLQAQLTEAKNSGQQEKITELEAKLQDIESQLADAADSAAQFAAEEAKEGIAELLTDLSAALGQDPPDLAKADTTVNALAEGLKIQIGLQDPLTEQWAKDTAKQQQVKKEMDDATKAGDAATVATKKQELTNLEAKLKLLQKSSADNRVKDLNDLSKQLSPLQSRAEQLEQSVLADKVLALMVQISGKISELQKDNKTAEADSLHAQGDQLAAKIRELADKGSETEALELLEQLEAKNEELTSLQSEFLQIKLADSKQQQQQNLAGLTEALKGGDEEKSLQAASKIKAEILKLVGLIKTASDKQQAALFAQKTKLGEAKKLAEDKGKLQLDLQLALVLEREKNSEELRRDEEQKTLIVVLKDGLSQLTAAAAKVSGNAELSSLLLVDRAQIAGELAVTEQGVDEQIDILLQTKAEVTQDLKKAEALKKSELVEQSKTALANTEKRLQEARREALFIEKKAAQDMQVSPLDESLKLYISSLYQDIRAIDKQNVTAAEQQQADELKQKIEAQYPKLKVLPADALVSRNLHRKLQVLIALDNGNTIVHIRPLLEAFDWTVDWSDNGQQVTVYKNGEGLHFMAEINKAEVVVNSKVVKMPVPARLVDQRTMVPLRSVSDIFGLRVVWDQGSQTLEVVEE